MNWDQIQGKWQQLKGEVKTRWGQLTDDDLTIIDGNIDQMLGKAVHGEELSRHRAWAPIGNNASLANL